MGAHSDTTVRIRYVNDVSEVRIDPSATLTLRQHVALEPVELLG
jgi:hypothetical protein